MGPCWQIFLPRIPAEFVVTRREKLGGSNVSSRLFKLGYSRHLHYAIGALPDVRKPGSHRSVRSMRERRWHNCSSELNRHRPAAIQRRQQSMSSLDTGKHSLLFRHATSFIQYCWAPKWEVGRSGPGAGRSAVRTVRACGPDGPHTRRTD
jgi:hypothetical protein